MKTWDVTGQAFNRKTGDLIGEPRTERIDSDNPLFADYVLTDQVSAAYEAFWNDLNPNSREVVRVLSVKRVYDRTCHLPDLRDGAPYTWGDLIALHDIGPYTVVEYAWRVVNDAGFKAATEIRFHPYISGWDTNHSYPTLDDALLACIAFKHDGINTQAPALFSAALRIDQHTDPQGEWNWIGRMRKG